VFLSAVDPRDDRIDGISPNRSRSVAMLRRVCEYGRDDSHLEDRRCRCSLIRPTTIPETANELTVGCEDVPYRSRTPV